MQTTDKWYTTKILSSILIVLIMLIFVFNQSFTTGTSENIYKLPIPVPEYEPMAPIAIKKETIVKVVEKKIVKKPNPVIKVVQKEVEPKPVEVEPTDSIVVVDNDFIDSGKFVNDGPVAIAEPVKPAPKPEPVENKIRDFSEVMPTYPGGERALFKFLKKNVSYPSYEQEIGKEGTVIASFVVSADGQIDEIEIVKSPSKGFSREAKSVISKMPDWQPGYHNGNAVAVRYRLPLKFRLN